MLYSSTHLLSLYFRPSHKRNQQRGRGGDVRREESRQQAFLLLSEVSAFMVTEMTYLSKRLVRLSLMFLPPMLLNFVIHTIWTEVWGQLAITMVNGIFYVV